MSMKLNRVDPNSLKEFEKQFLDAVKKGSLDIVSDKPCIVIDETLPDDIVKAADERITRERSLKK